MGSFPFAILVYFGLWVFVVIGLLCMRRKTKFKKVMLKINLYMCFSTLFRLLIITHFQLSVMSCYNLAVVLEETLNPSIAVSAVFAAYCLVGLPTILKGMVMKTFDFKQKGYPNAKKWVGQI